jgi:glutamate racemase
VSTAPIVVLDSGIGGLTVARALRQKLPHEDILYFGDTARVPYGGKSAATVTAFVRQIIRYLRPYNPKHVVIACNTATALALNTLRTEMRDLPISGVVEPGARAAIDAAGAKNFPIIAIIATEATIKSKAYEYAIKRRRMHARLICHATPLLVPIIEEGRTATDPLARLALQQYLTPLMQRGLDVLVLGCTHYPMLKGLIKKMIGPDVRVIDSAEECAEDVERRLQANQLLRGNTASAGKFRSFVTDNPQRFAQMASRFLGFNIAEPEWVSTDELYAMETDHAIRRTLRLSV